MAGSLARVDLTLLYPPFAALAQRLIEICAANGSDYYAISGFRSLADQARLYFQGRTLPGTIVTNARPGYSAHNYGVAIDFCRDGDTSRSGLQPDWNLAHYETLAAEAERLGLEPGLRWRTFREGPHVQLPLAAHGLTFETLKMATAGGTTAVFALLDAHGPWSTP